MCEQNAERNSLLNYATLCAGSLPLIAYSRLSYHSQTNEKTERYNNTIISCIRPYIAEHQRDWDVYLSPLTYVYYAHVHRTTNFRPF